MSVLVDDLLLLARLDHQRPARARARRPHRHRGRRRRRGRGCGAPTGSSALQAPGPVAVVGDADRLRQVVDNLLANAVQHTPDGSPVDVRVQHRDGDGAASRCPTTAPACPPTSRRTSSSRSTAPTPPGPAPRAGPASGLTIVSAIAHAHGGTVGVVSDPASDNGTAAPLLGALAATPDASAGPRRRLLGAASPTSPPTNGARGIRLDGARHPDGRCDRRSRLARWTRDSPDGRRV